jgi:hypothetical protein
MIETLRETLGAYNRNSGEVGNRFFSVDDAITNNGREILNLICEYPNNMSNMES